MKKLVFISLICVISTAALSKSLWRDRNIYSSSDTMKIGDTIVVSINDFSRMKFNLNMKNKTNSNVESNPDLSLTGFLPKVKSDRSSDSTDSFSVDSRNNLSMNIAATVTAVQGNNFAVAGVKEYLINGVSTRFAVTGIIDPSLMNGSIIRADNVVNFRLDISTTKRGMGINITRPPVDANKTADATLNENEKQRIILDYINRMIEELTRK